MFRLVQSNATHYQVAPKTASMHQSTAESTSEPKARSRGCHWGRQRSGCQCPSPHCCGAVRARDPAHIGGAALRLHGPIDAQRLLQLAALDANIHQRAERRIHRLCIGRGDGRESGGAQTAVGEPIEMSLVRLLCGIDTHAKGRLAPSKTRTCTCAHSSGCRAPASPPPAPSRAPAPGHLRTSPPCR
jgi:hypothetical protein